MRRRLRHLLSLTGIAAIVLLAAMPSGAAAGSPARQRAHWTGHGHLPGRTLRDHRHQHDQIRRELQVYADGTFLSTGNFRQDFTADTTGKQVTITGIEQVTGPFNPTDNGDGTLTETFTFKGMPMKVSVANGPTLVRDAGNATVAITFMLNPDGSRGDVLSDGSDPHGPHPQLDNDTVFCNAVNDALT